MGYVDWIAEVNSGRWSFLPGLIVAGVGLGFTWTPLYNIAMRDAFLHRETFQLDAQPDDFRQIAGRDRRHGGFQPGAA